MMGKKTIIYDDRKCSINPNHQTYIMKSGKPHWLVFEGNWVCKSCYGKLIQTPNITPEQRERKKFHNDRRTKEVIARDNKKRFLFRNKIVRSKQTLRIGKCSWCIKKIGDTYINHLGKLDIIEKTHIHHIRYHYDNPEKDTIELCPSCHMKESRRLENIDRNILKFLNNFIPLDIKQIAKLCNNNIEMVNLLLENSG